MSTEVSGTKILADLCDLAEARGVDGSVLGDGHRIPAFVLGGIVAPPPASPSTHPAAAAATTTAAAARLLFEDEGLLHLHLLPVLLQLGVFVDLVDGLGALVASSGHPGVLGREAL